MTLNWSKTAPDCVVVRELTPYVVRHLVRANGKWSWSENSPLYRPTRKFGHVVDEILAVTFDYLEADKYWDRTRHRLSTTHGIAQIRRLIEQTLDDQVLGFSCRCGTSCRYA